MKGCCEPFLVSGHVWSYASQFAAHNSGKNALGRFRTGKQREQVHLCRVELTATVSLPEFMNFKLFGKTILVVNVKFELFRAIHSASENMKWVMPVNSHVPSQNKCLGDHCLTAIGLDL